MSRKKVLAATLAMMVAFSSIPLAIYAEGASRESQIRSEGIFEYKDGDVTKVRINADDLKIIARGIDDVEARMKEIHNPDYDPSEPGNGEEPGVLDVLSGGTATEANVLYGKTFPKVVDGTAVLATGSMPDYSGDKAPTDKAISTAVESGEITDPAYTATGVLNLAEGYYNGDLNVDVTGLAKTYYQKGYTDGLNQSLNGSLVIAYHVHSNVNDAETRFTANDFDSYNAAVAGLSTATTSTTQGGCFQTPEYHLKQKVIGCTGTWQRKETNVPVQQQPDADGNIWYRYYDREVCSKCGRERYYWHDKGYWEGSHNSTTLPAAWVTTVPSDREYDSVRYRCNCGHENGEMLDITIKVADGN